LGVSAATKAIKVMDTVGTITVNMPAYNWTVEAGNIESSSYPYSTPNFTNATFIQIIPLTGVSPTTANVNIASTPADIPITFSLAGGTSLNSISNAGNDLRPNTDYTIANNVVTIKGSYLAGLSAGTATLTFNTSGTTDPTVTLTVMNGYEYGLAFKSGGLYYGNSAYPLDSDDPKLGGGSYTYNSDTKTLTLTNVNFTTTNEIALDLTAVLSVKFNLIGTNTFTSAYSGTSSTYGIASVGSITIDGAGSLTATAGTTSGTSYGILCGGTLTITNGEVTAAGESRALVYTSSTLPAAYEWEEDDEEGEYPYDALDYDGGERVYIKAVALRTRITSTGLTFNKADESASGINVYYTLAENVNVVGDPKIDGVAMAYGIGNTDFDYSTATLRTLSIGSHTIQLFTSDGVNPTVTLTVTAVYDYGLVLDRSESRLEYDGAEVTSEILGGGSYTYDYDTNTLTLTNVNFTTSSFAALNTNPATNVTINVIGTNTLTSTKTQDSYTYGIYSDNPEITGTGSLTLETDAGRAFILSPRISMSNYTWEAFTAEGVRTTGTSNYVYSDTHRKVTITYQAPYVPPYVPPYNPPPYNPPETEATTTTAETTTTPTETTTTPTETTPAETTTTGGGSSDSGGSSGGGSSSTPTNPPPTDTAPPPKNEIIDDETDEEPKEEGGSKLPVNGNTKDVAVNAIEDGVAEVTVNGKTVETASVTAAEYIDSGDVKEVFLTTSGAVSVVTKDGDAVAGANASGTLNSASTAAAIKAAAEDELVAEIDIITGNEIEAISKGAMTKIAETAADAGISANIIKNQYTEQEEFIYRITIEAVIDGARDVILSADFGTDVVEASKLAFERTFGRTDLGAFALNQKDSFGQSAKIQVKASAIGFSANPGDIIYVAIFNPETGEFVQVLGKMGESGFITFETELSGVVVMSKTSFK
jgi:hypothetical protein